MNAKIYLVFLSAILVKTVYCTDEKSVKAFLEKEAKLGLSEHDLLVQAGKSRDIAESLTYVKLSNDSVGQKRLIMWGTKWCGHGNVAKDFDDLGSFDQLDRCCRGHDNCPLKIHKNKQRWGVKNNVGYTVMDCKCDDEFYSCMKKVSGYQQILAWSVGKLFFNKLRTPCVVISKKADIKEPETDFDPEKAEDDDPYSPKGKTAHLRKAKNYKK